MNNRIECLLSTGKALFFSAIILFVLTVCHTAAQDSTVTVDVIHSTDKYAQGETYPILFRLNIKEGWFIHGTELEEEFLIPTVLFINDSKDMEIDISFFPDPYKKKFEYNPEPVEVYSGKVFVQGTVKVKNESFTGQRSVTGNLSYQACSYDRCLPPEDVSLTLDITVVPQGSGTANLNNEIFQSAKLKTTGSPTEKFNSGLFLSLLWIFLQGLALNLTPCIYPLIPITLSYFGGRSDKARGNTIFSGLLYLSGLSVTNSVLGVSAALSGSILGAALQYPAVLIFIAIVMTLLAFSFFGFWEFSVPSTLTRLASKNFQGYFGTFFMGLTLGIVAAPCIGPFIMSLLIYVGQKGDPFIGFLYFFVLSIGLGFPLCILAIFSGAINRLPKSGDWMLWVRKIMGWVLIAMGYYFAGPLINNPKIEHAVVLLLAVTAGIHLGWLDKSGGTRRVFIFVKRGISLIIILAGIFHFYSAFDFTERVRWTAYDDAFQGRAVQESKPVIMDVYADWCIPCRAMDENIFTDPEVLRLSENFMMIRLDITKKFPGQDEIRRKFSIEGAPTIIFFDKKGEEIPGLRIESKVDTDDFIIKMQKALGN